MFAVAKTFERPSVTAMLPSLVPPAPFPRATALATFMLESASILGPALGGLLWMVGAALPYCTSALLFFSAAVTIRLARLEQAAPPGGPVTVESVFGGLAFVRSRPVILGAISLDLFAVLLGGATALLRGAQAIGALAMSGWLVRRPLRRQVGAKMFAAVLVFGLATVGFGVSRSLPLSIVLLAILGAADVISMVVRQTLVQLHTPDAIRGRVTALDGLFISTSNQLGEFESGGLAALIGTVPAVVVGGVGTMLVPCLGRLRAGGG